MWRAPEVFTLGHSPDPDDAFMFYAIAKNKIDLRGYHFEHRLEDIQILNERAMRGELHISAVSIHACAYVADKYLLLPCGASMGDGYGPLVIEKHRTPNIEPAYAEGYSVAGSEHRTSHEDIRERLRGRLIAVRSEEHTFELQSLRHLVCRLLLEKKKKTTSQERMRESGCARQKSGRRTTDAPPRPSSTSPQDRSPGQSKRRTRCAPDCTSARS